VVTLCSFVVILWTLSAQAPLTMFGPNFNIPGYLVWGALLYAVIGTALTHLIGKPLIALNFLQQRFEANFRFNLVRTRENAEQIASLRGEAAEREEHLSRFGSVVGNWYALMQRQKRLMFFTQSYSQAADANRLRVQQRARGAFLFHHRLSADRRMALRHRPLDRIPGSDRRRSRGRGDAAGRANNRRPRG
jgi:hypothetical protein